MMLTALVLALLSAAPAPAEKPKLIVLDLDAAGVDPRVGSALSEAVTAEAAARGIFQVISSKDVQTLLGVERQKQMMGCSEGTSCLAELGGALGARFVMSGSVARLGSAFQLSLQTMDTNTTRPVGRSSRIARDLAVLRGLIPWAVAEATGTPLPPPPSRLLPYTLIAAGGLGVVAGGIFGFNALAREEVVSNELQLGQQNPSVLRSAANYANDADSIARQKTGALLFMGVGAAVVAAGLYLNPPDLPAGQSASIEVVPSAGGVAVVGGF